MRYKEDLIIKLLRSWRKTTEILGTSSVLFKRAETSGSSRKRHQRKGL